MNTSIWYCYAVARSFPDGAELAELAGIHGAAVHTITHGDLVAVLSPVSADEFGEAGLSARLEDLDWLEDVARSHNAVVNWVAQRSATLPFRLGTIYLDQPRVREVLATEEHRLAAALDRVAGRQEWGLKVYTDPEEQTPGANAPAADDGAGDMRPGQSYLRRRKAARQAREVGWQEALRHSTEIDRALSELADNRRQHRPQSQELSGSAGQNVLNVAYLVTSENSDIFVARARKLEECAVACSIELTGPWAPYSFAVEDLVAAEDEEPATEPR